MSPPSASSPPGLVRRIRAFAARPIAQTFAATVAIAALNVITGVILARALGPLGRGELAAALIWPTLLRFLVTLGVDGAITFRAARPGTRVPTLLGTALALGGAQGLVLVIAGVALLPLILSDYGGDTLEASLIILGTYAFAILGLYMLALLNGIHRFAAFNILRVLVILLTAVALSVLAIAGELSVLSAALCYLAGFAVAIVVSAPVVLRASGGIGSPDRGLGRSLLGYGWRSQLSSTRNPLNEQLDQFVISIFLAPVQLGLYAVAFTLANVIGFLSASVSVVALPKTAGSDDRGHRRSLARRYIGASFLVSLAIAAPLIVLAGPALELIFGAEFEPAADTTRILLGAAVMIALTRVASSVLNGLERPGDAGIAGAVSLGGTAVGLAILIPPLGIEGAALGTLCGYTASSVWCLIRLGGALGTTPLAFLLPPRER